MGSRQQLGGTCKPYLIVATDSQPPVLIQCAFVGKAVA